MKPSIYIETTIISFLTARTSKDPIANVWKQKTKEWWQKRRCHFSLCTSQLVEEEASRGDPEAAQKRLKALRGIERLILTEEVISFSENLLINGALPSKASDDALHVAFAAVHNVDFLLTWNCRHIDNAERKPQIRFMCLEAGYRFPEICTPFELMGDTQ